MRKIPVSTTRVLQRAIVSSVALVGALGLTAGPARADLSNDNAQVEVEYIAPAPGDLNPIDHNSPSGPVTGFVTVGSGVSLVNTAPSNVDVTINPTQIIITNESALPFCFTVTAGGGCADTAEEFDFLFQNTPPATGTDTANITGVTVDGASAPDFLPVSPIDLVSPTEFTINVENLKPNVGDSLVLDLAFASGTSTSVPEPASVLLLGTGLLGLAILRRPVTRLNARAQRMRTRRTANV